MAEKLKVSEKVKDTVSRLANKFKISFSSSPEEEKLNTPIETLGAIYKLLVENRQNAKDIHNMEKKEHKSALNQSRLRQRELIKALSFKPKKQPVVQAPAAQTQPKVPSASPSKPAPKTANQPAPKTQPKVETTPAPKTQPKVETGPKVETAPAPKTQPKVETTPAPKTQPKVETTPAPKTQPKVETTPAPKTQPKVETPAPKAEVIPKSTPKPAPKAEPIPKPAPNAGPSTAAKVIVGAGAAVASGVSLSQEIGDKIATHETYGATEQSYNTMNWAGKKDTMFNKYPLTQMTIGDVLDLAEKRRAEFNPPNKNGKRASIGVAMGKYQFMPTYVRGTPGNPGWAEQALGANWRNEPFSAENQEKMHDILFRQEVRGLKARGVPVSEATIYMTHFLGAAGAAALFKAPDDTPLSSIMTPVQLDSNKSYKNMTAGEYKARITSSTKNKIGLSFDPIDKKRLDEYLANTPVVDDNNKGKNVQSQSISNNDAKQKEMHDRWLAWKNQNDRTVNVTNQKPNGAAPVQNTEHDDRPAILKKAGNAK